MPPNQARLRWLIRLDENDEDNKNIEEDILALLRCLPEATAKEEKAEEAAAASAPSPSSSVNANKNSDDDRTSLQRNLLRNSNKNHARPLDRRRALVSCLAQHVACCVGLGLEWESSPRISRTRKGGKPFAKRRRDDDDGSGDDAVARPNFNFNVSHDGPWVALAAEPTLLVGVDVSAPRVIGGGGGRGEDGKNIKTSPPPLGVARLLRSLGSALSDGEWARVALEADAGSQDACFRRFWALREAWTKARGDGLGAADLARAEFSFRGDGGDEDEDNNRITLRLDGVVQEQWRFELTDLRDGSALAVARGPPSAVVDAGGDFRATLRKAEMSDEEVMREQDDVGGDSWHELSVRGLIEEAEMRRSKGREEGEDEEK